MVMHVLLIVLHVCMLRECEGYGNAGMGDERGMIAVSPGCECIGGTCGSGVVSSSNNVLRDEWCVG